MSREHNHKYHVPIAAGSVLFVAAACYPVAEWIGYQSVGLIMLLVVSILAMRLSLWAVILASIVSAAVWDFFFIPPYFTFTVNNSEDALLIAMYFIVAVLNGVINYRVRQFEQMRNQNEARVKALNLYNTLFSSLSHELRTPIAAIIGASDTLLEGNEVLSETQKKELLTEISKGSLRLSEQVENLLNMSRLEAGMIHPKIEWCDVADLTFGTVEKLREEGRHHRVEVMMPENFPLVQLDFGLTEQTLHNLLSNAFQHTPNGTKVTITAYILHDRQGRIENSGEVLPHIAVSERTSSTHRLLIEVTDNGPGFPTQDCDLAFDKFYRYPHTQSDGTGLGLYIVRGFTEAQGGEVSLCNREGGGAKFSLEYPTRILNQAIHDGYKSEYIDH